MDKILTPIISKALRVSTPHNAPHIIPDISDDDASTNSSQLIHHSNIILQGNPILPLPIVDSSVYNHRYPTRSKVHFACKVTNAKTRKQESFRAFLHSNNTIESMRLNSRELGSLTNSIANDGKNCQTAMRFIPFEKVPKNKPITYRKFHCTIRPHKKEIRRVRMVTGGDKLSYDGPATTETGKITTAKFLFNSIILTKN